MGAVAARHPYIEALLNGCEAPRGGASWLDERRAHALERANALTVPTTRDEEWRFTDVSPLTRVPFRPVAAPARLSPGDIARFVVPEAPARLVFVDGVFEPALSASAGLPDGVVVSSLGAALAKHAAEIEPHLARHAAFEHEVFAALNTVYLRDGAFVLVPRNVRCAAPVQVLHVSTQKGAAAYPRCLVVAGAGAALTLIEDYAGLGDAVYFNDAVTEFVVGEGAHVRQVRIQRESPGAFHIATCAAAVAKDARFDSHAMTFGARLSRLNLDVVQHGEGAAVGLDGLAFLSGRQLADSHTLMDHAQPRGRCQQLHKCVVADAAHAVFNGKILVRPGAQLTDSSQQSRNLLLSDKARVDTKPQLEIFADDVKCAHGATVGQLDPEQLFYLRSRGLPVQRARNLLIYAFAAQVIDRIPVPSLVKALEEAVLAETQAPTQPSPLPKGMIEEGR